MKLLALCCAMMLALCAFALPKPDPVFGGASKPVVWAGSGVPCALGRAQGGEPTNPPLWSISGVYNLKHPGWDACAFYRNSSIAIWPKIDASLDWDSLGGFNLANGAGVVGQALVFDIQKGHWSCGVGLDVILQQGRVIDGGFALSARYGF